MSNGNATLFFNNVTAINQYTTGTGSFFECYQCNFNSTTYNSYFGNNVASSLTSYGGVFYASCAGTCNAPPSMIFEYASFLLLHFKPSSPFFLSRFFFFFFLLFCKEM